MVSLPHRRQYHYRLDTQWAQPGLSQPSRERKAQLGQIREASSFHGIAILVYRRRLVHRLGTIDPDVSLQVSSVVKTLLNH